jgi:hypothetical protein
MAYCEAGQRECDYLDLPHEARQRVVIDQATKEEMGPDFANIVGNVAEEWARTPQSKQWHCSDIGCAIVKRAIGGGIASEARTKFEDFLRESDGN